MKNILSLSLLVFSILAFSQVGINTDTPQATLDVVSTESGVIVPRMNSVEIKAIPNAIEGMMVYNTSLNCMMINLRSYNDANGVDWRCLIMEPEQNSTLVTKPQ